MSMLTFAAQIVLIIVLEGLFGDELSRNAQDIPHFSGMPCTRGFKLSLSFALIRQAAAASLIEYPSWRMKRCLLSSM